jgi:hypothetical protein
MHAARPKRAPPGPSVLSFEDGEEESVVTLSGRGARVVGMALLDKLQEGGDVAVEDVEERGRSEPFEYIFRTSSPRSVCRTLELMLDGAAAAAEELEELKKIGAERSRGSGVWRSPRLRAAPRLEINLLRLYARDLLPVKHFLLDEDGNGGFRSRATGRLLPMPPLDENPSDVELWREAHYESTALAEALGCLALGEAVAVGRAEVEIPLRTLHGTVRASDLRVGGAVASRVDTDVLPLPPDAGISARPVTVGGVVEERSPVEGAPFSALPYARVNSAWRVEADARLLREHPRELRRLLDGNVCHRGLLKGSSATLALGSSDTVALAAEGCDGCGACVHLADHMPMLLPDIEDLPPLEMLEECARLPIRGSLRLVEEEPGTTVLEACSGTDEHPMGVLLRAAGALELDWRPAAVSDCDMASSL